MPEEIIEQSKKIAKEKDEVLTKFNNRQYTERNVKSKEQSEIKVDRDKSKVVERVVYKNGVEKSRIVGMIKKGKIVYNYGMEKKFLPGNKK